jgi:hypothetical protein
MALVSAFLRGELRCCHVSHSSGLWTTGINKGLAALGTQLGSHVSKAHSCITEVSADVQAATVRLYNTASARLTTPRYDYSGDATQQDSTTGWVIFRSYRVYNFDTNTVVESCDVTFNETASYPRGVFECAGDKKMKESIFIDEGLHVVNGDEDDPLLPSTSSPEHVPTSTLEAEAPQVTTSSTAAVVALRVEGEIISEPGALSHIQKAHTP